MSKNKTRTIAIASGKGGAGKTSVAACLAWILAEQGRKVCLVDMDLGLSNVDVLLGLTPEWTLEDVILGAKPIENAITTVRPGMDVISGGSGTAALADLDRGQRAAFLNRIKTLQDYDFLILDNSPGIHGQVVAFCLAAREQIIVINPEPASVTDGYALLKVLRQNGLHRPCYILLNRVPQGFAHGLLMQRFAAVCKKFLQATILPLGAVPDDPAFGHAAARSMLPVALYPRAPGVVALHNASALLGKRAEKFVIYSDAQDFWNSSLVNLMQTMRLPDEDPKFSKPKTMQSLMQHLERIINELDQVAHSGVMKESPNALTMDHAVANKMASAGSRLTSIATALREKNQRLTRLNIGVVCPDATLRSLLLELILEKGECPIVVNGSCKNFETLDLLMCSVNKPDTNALRTLRPLHHIPCIWLSEYKKQIPEWAAGLRVTEVVEKPFSLEKIYRALGRAASKVKKAALMNSDHSRGADAQ